MPQQPDDSKRLGSVEKRTPLHYIYNTNGEQFDNIQLNIDNKKSRNAEIVGVMFTPSSAGIENIMTILHESRHVAQFYAESVFMQNNQILAENELNAVAYLQLLGSVVSNLTQGINLASRDKENSLYPKIKNKYLTDEGIDVLRSYKLSPEEIDARKFALNEMERLAEKGYLDNTNWEKYKGVYLIDEFRSLNFSKMYSQDVCPTIKFLKERKQILEENLDIVCKFLEGSGSRPKELKEIENAIDFKKYYDCIQNFYNDLKTELRYIMIEESRKMQKEANEYKGEDEISVAVINKLKNGAEQIYDENYEMQLAVADKFSDNHTPLPKEIVKKINKENYQNNKDIKQKKIIDEMMKDIQENQIEEQPLDPDYEFERE